MNDILKLIIPLMKSSGDLAKDQLHNNKKIIEKPNDDIVTDVDLKIEKMITSFLLKEFPDFGILSEETVKVKSNSEYIWILDPIDGSKHYHSGLPFYSISLALKHLNEICLGAVYSPDTGEFFYAVKNHGAYLNEMKIKCKKDQQLKDSLVCVEIPSRHFSDSQIDSSFAKVKKIIKNCKRIRIIGTSALGLSYCALGGFGAYVNLSLSSKEWDLAAGEIIVKEAGGVVSMVDNIIIAGPNNIHDNIIQILELRG
ncbi:MAG: hypothetical protein KAW56_11210 [Candidatus Marinimicrobia bacterium]|nr:hypothetical protein [Candidatus Neomarinimicrobiota bacterium]MCK4447633.1 hypothetical protein [Candidatus Neomarinimicrobiota bacterium]